MNSFKEWAKAAAIRAIKTFAQTAVSMLTVGQAFIEVNWQNVISIAGVAAIISILTSIAGIGEANDGASPLSGSQPVIEVEEVDDEGLEEIDDEDLEIVEEPEVDMTAEGQSQNPDEVARD